MDARIRTVARPQAGIRRCGVLHTPEGITWPEGQFTDEQIEVLKRDPDVVVEFVTAAVEAGAPPASAKRGAAGK